MATPSSTLSAPAPSKALHSGLWAVQIVLALMFGAAGLTKTLKPIAELAGTMAWVTRMPEGVVRFIGVSEVLGALGLILPSVTRIKPKLTVLAAVGLVVVMVLALGHHLMNGEAAMGVPVNGVLGALAAFVAWGRWSKAPISPK